MNNPIVIITITLISFILECDKMIGFGVDQFTLVFQLKEDFKYDQWRLFYADRIMKSVITSLKFIHVFEDFDVCSNSLPEGYTTGFGLVQSPYYLKIAYNDAYPRMGVILKFSATAWAEYSDKYKKKYNEDMNIILLLELLNNDLYTYRFSRIDIFCDFIDEGIDVHQIYESLASGRTEVRYGR